MPLITSDLEFSDDYPTIEPSLKLDFANSRALDPRITFTRASSASYVGKDGLIKLAKANEPRFDHDPITGESLGLLIEEERTNYQSGNTTSFGVMDIPITQGVSTASDVTTAPNGIQQAGRISASGVDEIQRIGYNTQSTASGQYNIFSVFVKADSGTPILGFYSNTFVANNVAFNVDLSDGTTNTINAPADFVGKVEPFRNGWYRVSVMGTGSGAGGSWNINIVSSLTSARGAQSGSNNASASYFIWGVQEELSDSPFASSVMFIQKAGSFTREKEFPIIETSSIDFKEFTQGGEGTLVCEFSNAGSIGSDIAICFSGDTHNGATFVGLGTNSNRNAFNRNRVNTTNNVLSTDINFTTTGFYKVGFGIGQSKCTLAVKGSSSGVLEDTSVSYDSTPYTKLILGCDQTSSSINNMINGTIKSVFYYPTLLTNSQLQSAIGIPTEAPPPPPPPIQGQAEYTTAGSYTWTAPTGVTSVCVVCVGGGSASGGALAYRNNITVVPGTGYSVVVGAGGVASGAGGSSSTDGGDSSFSDGTNTTIAGGGKGQATAGGAPSGTYDGGGSGGDNGAWGTFGGTYNGAGAGGYSGDGGNSLVGGTSSQAGSGGGGSSGSWAYESGGGVGIYGEGTSGAAVTSSQGQGGSGGQNGQGQGIQNANSVTGGAYGGGFSSRWSGNVGGGGAVRIIWGSGRAFPSTNTADV